MIDYSVFDLPDETKYELMQLEISYVFQPIFDRKGEIFAYEALMRPKNENVMELIERYTKINKLHILELATFLGAFQEYEKRGYREYIHINSFPSEYLTEEECLVFAKAFPNLKTKVVVEMLEYLDGFDRQWDVKKPILQKFGIMTAVDDFGTGENTIEAIELYQPNIIKFDRSLISEIQVNPIKQAYAQNMVEQFHKGEYYLVAEGVETKEEFEYLMDIGFDLFQGFYLAKPL